MEVPEDFEQKIDACIDKAKFRIRESAYLKSFMVNGFDTRSVGKQQASLYISFGPTMNDER